MVKLLSLLPPPPPPHHHHHLCYYFYLFQHSKNCGVKITPPVLIEDHTMHFTPVLKYAVLVQPPVVLF